MWYTTNVGPDVLNSARELALNMCHSKKEHWKALGRLIGYLKGKRIIGITVINTKVIKEVMFCDSNYATNMETGKNVRGLVAKLGGTLLTYY